MISCFSLSKVKPPSKIKEEIESVCNYTFIYDHNLKYESFILNNPNDKFDIISYRKLTEPLKRLVFILYYLYKNGGFYIDLKVIPTKNINYLNFDNFSLITVKSIMNQENLFLGIIGCKKHEEIVMDLIMSIIKSENYQNIDENTIYKTIKNLPNVLYLDEKRIFNNCVSTVNSSEEILFNHYFNDNSPYRFDFTKKPKYIIGGDNSKIKIGITLLVFKEINKFFSNGINQNSLYLCELMLNIGFDVFFILSDEDIIDLDPEILKIQLYDNRFKYIKYSEILSSDLDIFVTLSFSDSNAYIHNYLRYMKIKRVGYFCGNSYIIDTEKILYSQHKDKHGNYDFMINCVPKFDIIWCIPQMTDTNLHYWKILHRCDVISVPFVWSTSAIKLHSIVNKCSETDLLYKIKPDKQKKIAIFEPNISIMKWALPSILICENSYRNHKNIKHLYVTNISSEKNIIDFNMSQFNKLLSNIDLVRDKKCSVESRYNTLEFMTKIADIAVSHQWGNPLNYLYFDLAWLGYPIVHNANLCKDVGYYYDDFNYTQGSEILNFAINNHDKNLEKYIIHNRKCIDRFLCTNVVLMKDYEILIYNLFDK